MDRLDELALACEEDTLRVLEDALPAVVSARAEGITVIVKRVGSSNIDVQLSIPRAATVFELKTKIMEELASEKYGGEILPEDRQRLIFAGRMLINGYATLIEDVAMKVDDSNYVHLVPLPEGVDRNQRRRSENSSSLSGGRPSMRRAPYSSRRTFRDTRRVQASPYGSTRPRLHPQDGLRADHARFPDLALDDAELDLYGPMSAHAYHPPALSVGLPATAAATMPVMYGSPRAVLVANPFTGASEVVAIPTVAAVSVPVVALDPLAVNPQEDIRIEIWQRANEILPLCRILPEQLMRTLTSSGSDSSQIRELRYQTELEETATVLDNVARQGVALADDLRRFIHARQMAVALHRHRRDSLHASDDFDEEEQDPHGLY